MAKPISGKARCTIAGPGQMPDNPHPIPKIIEPRINFLSIRREVTQENGLPSKVFRRFFIKRNSTKYTITAEPKTKRRAGFQFAPPRVKKFLIFSGSIIPDNESPHPKRTPDMK